MKKLKEYTIPFVGLKDGEHLFEFNINKTFFEYFEYDEFKEASIKLEVKLIKKATLLEFDFNFNGTVNVACDNTNELFDQPVLGTFHFVVKFGDSFNNENEELLIIPHRSYEVSIQQYVYESIILSLPTRRIHPGVIDGTLNSDILQKIEELRPSPNDSNKDKKEETDPRWDTLKKLLTDK